MCKVILSYRFVLVMPLLTNVYIIKGVLMSVLEDKTGPHVNCQSFHVFGIFLSLQSNLVPPKTSLKTKRRNPYPSWSRTHPSEGSLAQSMYLCKASSKEAKRSMFSVALVACVWSLRWKLRKHLTRYNNMLNRCLQASALLNGIISIC